MLSRWTVPLTLALLLVPSLLAVEAAAQSGDAAFTLLAVARSGDNVTFDVKAVRVAVAVTVSLYDGGTLAALPEKQVAHWDPGEERSLTFTLLKDVKSATLAFRWSADGGTKSQNIGVPIPAREESSGGGAPRVLVDSVTLRGTNLTVAMTNVGNATTGALVASVEDAQGRKLATPYYRTLPALSAGATAEAKFSLPQKLEAVVVALEYAGRTERTAVVVRVDDAAGGSTTAPPTNVTLRTDLAFREADIGRTVDFVLTVRNAGRLALVQLDVDGLPTGYSARFFVGGSAVPSLYLDRNQSRQVTLSLTVPNSEAEVDRTADFAVVARVNGTPHARLPMGLVVRGVGQLEVSGTELIASVPPGGTGRFTITVRNVGSAPVFDVELTSNRPYGWTMRFDPRRLDRLDPDQSQSVSVEVRAPDVIGPGRYVTDVSAKSGDVTSRATTLSLEVPEAESTGGWLWVVFLGLIAGTLGFAAWRKRTR